jgi:hypothetical protein
VSEEELEKERIRSLKLLYPVCRVRQEDEVPGLSAPFILVRRRSSYQLG